MDKWTLLFDLDGVITDTEPKYDAFWLELGDRFLGDRELFRRIKGKTLDDILRDEFSSSTALRSEVERLALEYESRMDFDFIPGALDFIASLDRDRFNMAVVTSSGDLKMARFFSLFPDFQDRFDLILTAERFAKGKPDPCCYLMGMEAFKARPQRTVVFEDSLNGLRAARLSGAHVVGLATTVSRDAVAGFSDLVIDDFQGQDMDSILERLS